MVGVGERHSNRISEYRRGLAEGHSVLAPIRCGRALVPLELHGSHQGAVYGNACTVGLTIKRWTDMSKMIRT